MTQALSRARPDQRVTQDPRVLTVGSQDPRDPPDQSERRELVVRPVPQVPLAHQAPKDHKGTLDHEALSVHRVQLDQEARPDHRVQRVPEER